MKKKSFLYKCNEIGVLGNMRARKIICISITLIFLFALSGCSQNASSRQTSNNQTQNGKLVKPPQSNDSQSEDTANNNNSAAQNNNSAPNSSTTQSNSSQLASGVAPKTQQEVLNRVAAVLNTKVPLMLPTNMPVYNGKYLTATTISKTEYYKINFFESSQPADINSSAALKGELTATVEGTKYNDAASAEDDIGGYSQVEPSKYPEMEIDLGHSIKALGDAGLGHGYLTWNEGRWCIRVDSPNNIEYINKNYPDSKKLAQSVVEYLDNHMLPAPQKIGVISIDNWNNSNGTIIQWQYNQIVYKVWSQDPLTALKIAVAMKFKY